MEGDQHVGLHLAPGGLAVAATVGEPHPLAVAAGGAESTETLPPPETLACSIAVSAGCAAAPGSASSALETVSVAS